ncbi:MFS transporter [Streptomyces sp. NPDC007088]|uniref:MFS transporter n=1 Tax=Streptomyces sp. NPDC007088 TaxID=3364773 RepID=UPI0036ADA1A9
MRAERMSSTIRPARWAVTAIFGINGVLIASLAVRTPSLKQDLGLSAAQLGLVSALFGVTGVLTMQVTGALTARFGSKAVVRVVTPALPVLLLGIGAAPQYLGMAVLQMAFGAVNGMLDVSMNVHAVAVERAAKRHIINGCHGAWSVGSVIGALLGSGAAHIGMSRGGHYAVLAVVLTPAALVAGRFLLPTEPEKDTAAAAPARRGWSVWRTGWTRQLLVFGAMGATVLTAEAAAADWSGVFLHDVRHATLGLAGLGYVAFAACETSLRLVGDRIQARVSARRLLFWSGLTATAGMTVVVLSPWPWLGIAGFGVTGLGLATSLPVLFGLVGHLGAEQAGGDAGAATMVSRFTTMTYTGIMIGPAIIGWVAHLVGLTWTLTLLIPFLLGTAVAARTVDLTGRRTEAAPADADAAQ